MLGGYFDVTLNSVTHGVLDYSELIRDISPDGQNMFMHGGQ